MSDPLRDVFSAEIVEALERLVDERVREALEAGANGDGSPWLTLDEAADYLRVSPRTLERLLEAGRVRTSTVGRRRLVHRDELDAYMRNGDGRGNASHAIPPPGTNPRRRRPGGVG